MCTSSIRRSISSASCFFGIVIFCRDSHILAESQFLIDAWNLHFDTHSFSCTFGCRNTCNVLALKYDTSGGCRVNTHYHLKNGLSFLVCYIRSDSAAPFVHALMEKSSHRLDTAKLFWTLYPILNIFPLEVSMFAMFPPPPSLSCFLLLLKNTSK